MQVKIGNAREKRRNREYWLRARQETGNPAQNENRSKPESINEIENSPHLFTAERIGKTPSQILRLHKQAISHTF